MPPAPTRHSLVGELTIWRVLGCIGFRVSGQGSHMSKNVNVFLPVLSKTLVKSKKQPCAVVAKILEDQTRKPTSSTQKA